MMDTNRICFHCMETLERPGQVCPRCGWDNTYRENDVGELPATVLNGMYFIGRKLGRGGFGITYLGKDLNLDRRVAVKEYYPLAVVARHRDTRTVRPYSDARSEFERGRYQAMEEARRIVKMAQIPNIVQVFGAFEENGTVYIVMDYIPGKTLAALVREQGPLRWARVQELMLPIMSALESVHRRGVIHRDISPDNIMLSRREGSERTYLLDFGAARSYSDNPDRMTQTLRPGYAPPEQYSTSGVQNVRTDEYALCATIYYLLTGKTPSDSTQLQALGQTMPPSRALGSDIPPHAEAALMRGMSARMEDRYASLEELRQAFADLPDPPKLPRKKYVGIVAIVCAFAVAGLAWGVTKMIDSSNPGSENAEEISDSMEIITHKTTTESISEQADISIEDPTETPTHTPTSVPTDSPTPEPEDTPTPEPIAAPTVGIPVLAVEPNGGSKSTQFHTLNGDRIESIYTLDEADEYQLSWAAEGAVDYEVRISGIDGTEVWNVDRTKNEEVGLSASELTAGEIYELHVVARAEGGEAVADASRYFMLNPTPTPPPTASPTPMPPTATPTPTLTPTPSPTPGSTEKSSNWDEMRLGDTGEAVRQIQIALVERNYLYTAADGSFGENTENAVRALQADAGLPQTGTVDSATRAALSRYSRGFEPQADNQLRLYAAEYDAGDACMYVSMKNQGRSVITGYSMNAYQCDELKASLGNFSGTRNHAVDDNLSTTYIDSKIRLAPGDTVRVRIANFRDGGRIEGGEGAYSFFHEAQYARFALQDFTSADGTTHTAAWRIVYAEFQEPEYRRGDEGYVVRRIQKALIERNYLYGIADEKYGEATEAAIKRLQQDAGLRQTGVATMAVRRALESYSRDFEPQGQADLCLYTASYDVGDGSLYVYFKNMGSSPVTELAFEGERCDASKSAQGELWSGIRTETGIYIGPGEVWALKVTDHRADAGEDAYAGFRLTSFTTEDGARHTANAKTVYTELGQ